MTARQPEPAELVPDPVLDRPTGLVQWPATWATDVARDAKRFRQDGIAANVAWRMAADLHRPTELASGARSATQRPRTYKPRRPNASEIARQILADAPEPMTTREFAEAMGIQSAHALVHLRRHGVIVGQRESVAPKATNLWELNPNADIDEGRQTTHYLRIVEHLRNQTQPRSVPEIARALGIPRATVGMALLRVGRIVGERRGRGGGNPSHLWALRPDNTQETP